MSRGARVVLVVVALLLLAATVFPPAYEVQWSDWDGNDRGFPVQILTERDRVDRLFDPFGAIPWSTPLGGVPQDTAPTRLWRASWSDPSILDATSLGSPAMPWEAGSDLRGGDTGLPWGSPIPVYFATRVIHRSLWIAILSAILVLGALLALVVEVRARRYSS